MIDTYPTSDTPLASYLITEGYLLESIDYSRPRFVFHFRNSSEIQKTAASYISGNALTDPSAYIRINKQLLTTIAHRQQWEVGGA